MEIKSIPEIIKEMDTFVRQERYDEAYQFAKEKRNMLMGNMYSKTFLKSYCSKSLSIKR